MNEKTLYWQQSLFSNKINSFLFNMVTKNYGNNSEWIIIIIIKKCKNVKLLLNDGQ